MHRNGVRETSIRGWRASAVAGCVALLPLVSIFGCGDSQDAGKPSANKPTTQAQRSTTPPDKAKPKPKAQKPKPHSDQAKREAAAKRESSRAAASAKVTAGRDLPSRSGPVAAPGRAVACLKKRSYAQTRMLTGAQRRGSGSTSGTVVVTVGPLLKSHLGATVFYFSSVAQAKRLGDSVTRTRTRAAIPGAYQVIGRAVIQYVQTPQPKASAALEACIRSG